MTRCFSLRAALALAAASVFSTASIAEDREISLSTGYDQSSGDYGSNETTTIRSIPLIGKVEQGPWTLKVATSWLEIDDASLIPGTTSTQSGPGDVNVSASYLIYPSTKGGPFFEVTGKVKVPTADEKKELGSGATDYAGLVSVFQPLGKATLSADAGYRIRGESDIYDLQNGFVGSASISYKLKPQLSSGVTFSYGQSATDTSDEAADVMAYLTFKARDDWSLMAYGVFGLSDSSPDTGFGLAVKKTFK